MSSLYNLVRKIRMEKTSGAEERLEEMKRGADEAMAEAEQQLSDTQSPPSLDQVFEKRRTAAKVRYIAALEKAYAKMLDSTDDSQEEALARFELRAEAAEADFNAELQILVADQLELSADRDLSGVEDSETEAQEQAKLMEEQKKMAEQNAPAMGQLGGFAGSPVNAMAAPDIQQAQQQQMMAG